MQNGRPRPDDGPVRTPGAGLRWTPPTSSWVEFQPRPIRLACYVLAWSFVLMVILALFLPLAAGGLEKVVS